jgi:CotH kinase protein/GEVED domain/Chitobiase/beta-hexosaminidase C-terminal domain/HYR domain
MTDITRRSPLQSRWKLAIALAVSLTTLVSIPFIPLRTSSSAAVILPTVQFSVPGGDSAGPVTVALTSATSGAAIYYTLDGNDPSATTSRYTAPLTISQPTSVKAIAVLGADTSPIATRTYIAGTTHVLPILAISAPPAVFFDPATGLFPNALVDITAITNVEFYDANGTQAFNQFAETEVQGTASASYPQKSLAFKAKASLGGATPGATFAYPLYPNRPFQAYKSFVGRNSGQDFNYSQFRDVMTQGLVGDVDDVSGIIRKPNVDSEAGRPVAAYLNGKYYGLLNMQERADNRYIDTHYGIPKASLDLLENQESAKEGDRVFYDAMNAFANSADLTNDANLATLGTYYDLDNLIDSYAFMVYVDGSDWPDNNNVTWRNRVVNGPFRSLLKDLDFSMGLAPIGGVWNSGDATGPSLRRLMVPPANGYDHPNATWSTQVFRAVIKNKGFRDKFVNRLNDYANVILTSSRITGRVNQYSTLYGPERKRHLNLYASGVEINALKAEASMKLFAANRLANIVSQVDGLFADVGGRAPVAVSVQPAGSGGVDISSLTLRGGNLPKTYDFFQGTQIPISATAPAAGFTFQRWIVSGGTVANANAASTTLTITGAASVQAVFTNGPGGPAAQTISFPAIAGKTTTSPPFTVAATASSGLPVTFAIASGPATIAGNTITLTGTTGTVTVSATQAGNANFLPATAQQSFAVTGGPGATLTFNFTLTDRTVAAAAGATSAVVSWVAPTASSTCAGGATVAQIDGPGSGSAIPIGVVTVTYRASDACGNTQDRSFTVTVTGGSPGTYCSTTSAFPWHEWLSNVTFDGIANASVKTTYSNFTALTAAVVRGQSYPLGLTTSFSYSAPDEYLKVWIDYNRNNVFDANEVVADRVLTNIPDGAPPALLTTTVVVPATATAGTTRMRVTLSRDPAPNACGAIAFGEIEDYTVSIS